MAYNLRPRKPPRRDAFLATCYDGAYCGNRAVPHYSIAREGDVTLVHPTPCWSAAYAAMETKSTWVTPPKIMGYGRWGTRGRTRRRRAEVTDDF